MRIPFKLTNNETEISFDLPQKWEEVSNEEFVRLKTILLQDNPTLGPSELLFSFSGIEQKFWRSITPEKYAEPLSAIMRFWNDSPPAFMKLEVPEVIQLNGRFIKIKKDVALYSLGVVETMTQRFDRWAKAGHIRKGTLDELIIFSADVLALFLQQDYDGKGSTFDEDESRKLIPYINALPAVQTIPLACFFLSVSLQLLNDGLKILGVNPTQSQRKQGLTN